MAVEDRSTLLSSVTAARTAQLPDHRIMHTRLFTRSHRTRMPHLSVSRRLPTAPCCVPRARTCACVSPPMAMRPCAGPCVPLRLAPVTPGEIAVGYSVYEFEFDDDGSKLILDAAFGPPPKGSTPAALPATIPAALATRGSAQRCNQQEQPSRCRHSCILAPAAGAPRSASCGTAQRMTRLTHRRSSGSAP